MLTSGPLGSIILVDDDPNIADLLKFNLTSEGFGVDNIPLAKDATPDALVDARLIIIDAMQQEYSGLDLIKDLKADNRTAEIPIIVCTTRTGEDTIVEIFDLGADDIITKPFSLRELIARTRAVLRRHPLKPNQRPHHIHQGNPSVIDMPALRLIIDTSTQRVIEDGIIVPLTKTEYAILIYLIKNQNSFFTRDQICVEVWKDEAGANSRIVDTNISRLRKKLGESGKCIINRYGMGYAFVENPA